MPVESSSHCIEVQSCNLRTAGPLGSYYYEKDVNKIEMLDTEILDIQTCNVEILDIHEILDMPGREVGGLAPSLSLD